MEIKTRFKGSTVKIMALIFMMLSIKMYSQSSCFSNSISSCCSAVGFTFNPSITYSGNKAIVQFAPSYTFSAGTPCRLDNDVQLTFNFGDATPASSTYTYPSFPSTLTHTYTLSNACNTNTFLVQACVMGTGNANQFTCLKEYTLSIPTPSSSLALNVLNTGCKTYSLSYSGLGSLSNVQWYYGDGNNSPVITTGSTSIVHTYPTSGNYVITLVADGFTACPVYTQVAVSDIISPDFNYTVSNVCDPSAGIILSIPGYTSSLSYQWQINNLIVPSLGASGTYTTNLSVGTNTVKLLIAGSGCNTQVSKAIQIGSPSANFSVNTQSLCSGDVLSPIGVQSGGDTYTWKIKKPDNTFDTPLSGINPNYMFTLPGTYTVTLVVTNTYVVGASVTTCSNTSAPVTISVNAIPNPTFVFVPQLCNGSVSLNIPTSTYTSYTLNYGNSTQYTGASSIPSVQAGNTYTLNGVYTVSLNLNNNGCVASYNTNVNVSSLTTLTINTPSSFLCAGSTNTLMSLLNGVPANAGTVTYTWSGPSSFTSNQPLIAVNTGGSYTLNVSSNGACPISLSAVKTITALAAPTGSLIGVTPISCSSATTSAVVEISAALQQQGYYINGNYTAANPSATAALQVTVNGLVNGANYINIANGLNQDCSGTLLANVTYSNPVLSVAVTQPTNCGGGAVGSATASATPGTGTISWYKVSQFPNTVLGTGTSIGSLAPGNYLAQIVNGYCSATQYFTIGEPVINLNQVGPNGTCPGSTAATTINAQFTPTAVSSSLSYSWNLITGTVVSNVASGSSNTQSLSAGNYSVIVTAANGCNASLSFVITEYEPITINMETTLPSCNVSGNVQANVSGGDGNYTYNWFFNGSNTGNNTNIQSLATLTAVTTVSLSVNDQSGCTATAAPSPSVITPPSSVSLTACSGSTLQGLSNATKITGCDISACVTGGVAPYTFEWYKLVTKTSIIQWHFYYNASGQFIANNGTQTLVVTVPTSTSNLAALTQSLNINDSLNTTVMYPYWTFTTSPAKPLLNNAGTTLLGSATATSSSFYNYFTVNETIKLTSQEVFVASYSGNSGTAYPHGDFTDGIYKLYVTDANGCKYPFSIGSLTFPKPTTFAVSFDYVWGMHPVQTTVTPVDVVLQDDMIQAASELLDDYGACLQKKTKDLKTFMRDGCGKLDDFKDALDVSYELTEHHYTLYYYDRAGQLTKTVPPEGVELLSQTDIDLIKANRTASTTPGTWTNTAHRMPSQYQYNSFGQLLAQKTPDGGETQFIYDSKNRLRFSQNERQKNASPVVYSYTKYDELGRITEVGESSYSVTSLTFTAPTATLNLAAADNSVFPAGNNKQITTTVYSSVTPVTYYGKPQRFLQNRVSYSYIDENPATTGDEHYTYYSYDSHGNVEWLVQDYPNGIGKNYIAYDYDLVSGKVLKVSYNEQRLDRFYHRYLYDAENRLTQTQTSRDGELWDNDASYSYYPHGPLKRSVIGEDHVQGLDYVYTIHGWLKSINSPSLSTSEDPGEDNSSFLSPPNGNPQEKVAADRHGMILNYYNGDYTRSGNFLSNGNNYALASYSTTDAPSLYNGNISSWVQSQLNTITTNPIIPRADLFKYDLLNRIKQSTALESNTVAVSSWSAIGTSTATFKTSYDYDANGNILNLTRFDNNGAQMDNIDYTYDNGAAGTASLSNRLSQVKDNDASFLTGRGDLEGTHSYTYDAIGNLIKEVGPERLNLGAGTQTYVVNTDISWTVYGKIKEVLKASDPGGLNRQERITFAYDATGNRVKKEYWKDGGSSPNGQEEPEEITTTFYVRDAQGNIMSTYKKYYDITNNVFKYDLLEQPIYGSDRLGQSTHSLTLASNATYSNLATPANGGSINSEYQNWLTTTNKSQLLPNSGANNNLCQCKVMSISNSTANPNYSSVSSAVEFLGIANNGIAVAENLAGELQFYVVLAKKYLGNADACLVFDKEGKLMQGTELIGNVDVNSKPVIVNVPNSNLYNIITLNAAKQPVSHLVDMAKAGYGPTGNMGQVINVNQALTANTNTTITHGFHFTGLENHIAGEAVVYSSRFTPDPLDNSKGTTDLLAYNFGSGTTTPQESLLYSIYGCGNTETGELQLSPNGNKLAWYRHDKTISGFKTRTGYIYTLPLAPNKTSLNGTVDVHSISDAGNYGNGVLEFMANSNDILYAQRGMYTEGPGSQKYDRNVWKYDPINLSTLAINPDNLLSPVNISYLFGEIKRGSDGRFYIPNMGSPADNIHSYTGSSWTGTVNVSQATYQFASALPTQVWKLYADPTQTLSEYPRYVGDKDYELKDHLGNVRVVVSDEKLIVDNNSNNTIDNSDDFIPVIKTYSSYYPFGQLMPTLQFNSGDYRYGMNGKEKDDEIKGGGNSYDFGARMYDPRLGRWMSCDPLQGKYPDFSPYNFTLDNPILFVDPDGRIVTIKDVGSLKAVLGTLSAAEVSRIIINKDGTLSIKAITGPNSRNLTNLQTLIDSKVNHNFMTSDNYESKVGNVKLPDNVYGRTVLPASDHAEGTPESIISPDNDVYIVIRPNTEAGAVDVTAHEAYGHAVLAERKRKGENVNHSHDYDPVTMKDKNADFGKQAWPAIGEARKNYKENSQSEEYNKAVDKKVEEFNTKEDKPAGKGIPYKLE